MLSRRTVLALALTLIPCLAASRPADGKSDFAAAIEQVQKQVDAKRWKEAKALLATTLGAHVDQPYVREARDSVLSIAGCCAFELAVPNGGVKDLFRGEVVKYAPKTGEIELRWDRAKLARGDAAKAAFPGDDFEATKQGTVLRVPFDGPHSMELSGKAIGQKTPCLLACIEDERWYEARLDAGSMNVIERIDGDARKTLGSTTTLYNVVRPYVLKLTVRAEQLEASHNGARLILVEKEKGEFGRAGFRDVLEPAKIVVQGKVRTKWIEEELAARREKARAEFEKTHDILSELPEWLRKG